MPIGSRNMRFAVAAKVRYAILNNIALTPKYQFCSLRYFGKRTFVLFIVHRFANYVNIVQLRVDIFYRSIELILTLHVLRCNE